MNWFRRPAVGDEIDEELRFHLEEKERRLVAGGRSQVDPRCLALSLGR